MVCIVATTCRNSTHSLLTSAKLSNKLSSSRDYKRTQQGALATLLLYLYKFHVVCATTILTCCDSRLKVLSQETTLVFE